MLTTGSPLPDFALPDQHSHTHRLADFKGRWLVVFFYPRDNTPGCKQETLDFAALEDQFKQLNASIVGVSQGTIASKHKFACNTGATFPLLADENKSFCEACGVWREKKFMGKTHMGIVRTTLLIDPQGVVAKHYDKVKVKGHAQAVLDELQQHV